MWLKSWRSLAGRKRNGFVATSITPSTFSYYFSFYVLLFHSQKQYPSFYFVSSLIHYWFTFIAFKNYFQITIFPKNYPTEHHVSHHARFQLQFAEIEVII